jgi:hypothetical protein
MAWHGLVLAASIGANRVRSLPGKFPAAAGPAGVRLEQQQEPSAVVSAAQLPQAGAALLRLP